MHACMHVHARMRRCRAPRARARSPTWRVRVICARVDGACAVPNERLRLPPPDTPVPVYVATLLPPHPFVIGAEPALTRAVCDALFGRVAEQRSSARAAQALRAARGAEKQQRAGGVSHLCRARVVGYRHLSDTVRAEL